jgi:uncharacterized protein
MGLSKILQVLVPKDVKFFPLFDNASSNLKKVAEILVKIMRTANTDERIKLIQEVKILENTGDSYTHDIFHELNGTFITPFDREDIQELASSLDNVVDLINGACQKIELYQPKTLTSEMAELADILLESSIEIEYAVKDIKNLKNPKKMMDACIKINSLENKADDIYHKALSKMFQNEKDAIELIKGKEIVMALEKATDRCEDVADVLKNIIIKNA